MYDSEGSNLLLGFGIVAATLGLLFLVALLSPPLPTLPPAPPCQEIRIGLPVELGRSSCWGSPSKINTDVGSWGIHEQWVYRSDYGNTKYLYFKNGYLTSWSY